MASIWFDFMIELLAELISAQSNNQSLIINQFISLVWFVDADWFVVELSLDWLPINQSN